MGLTGLEPVTLRLSSACSNQLSYRPGIELIYNLKFVFKFYHPRHLISHEIRGGKGIRTPDIQLAKLALYQLSYAPGLNDRLAHRNALLSFHFTE